MGENIRSGGTEGVSGDPDMNHVMRRLDDISRQITLCIYVMSFINYVLFLNRKIDLVVQPKH